MRSAPRALRAASLLAFVACGDLPSSSGETDVGPDGQPFPSEWADYEDQVLDLVNQERFTGGQCGETRMTKVDPLEMDDVLRDVARAYSQRMGEEGFFDHYDPAGKGPEDRVADAGFGGAYPIGENIAMGARTPEEVVDGWMHSEGHCLNILEGDFHVIGIGLYEDPSDPMGFWWTQDFAGSH